MHATSHGHDCQHLFWARIRKVRCEKFTRVKLTEEIRHTMFVEFLILLNETSLVVQRSSDELLIDILLDLRT